MNSLPLALTFLLLPLLSHAATKSRSLQQHEVSADKELLITALDVVNAPEAAYPGPWSFGHLMEETFGKEQARKAVARWLDEWAHGVKGTSATVPGTPGREQLAEQLIVPWQQLDGHRPGDEWLPNFSHAPFRLLAIVNRMDLGRPEAFSLPSPGPLAPSAGYYSGGSGINSDAGEARLIFGAVGRDGEPLPGGMTVIFEYGLDALKHERVFDWAMAWHRLGASPSFDAGYRSHLASLTRLFTDRRPERVAGNEAVRKEDVMDRLAAESTGGSLQLLRVRVNDGACGKLREFREFTLSDGALVAAPLAGTPDEVFFEKGSAANRWLSRWLEEQRVAPASQRDNPRAAKTEIPASFPLPPFFGSGSDSRPLLAVVAKVPDNDANFHWDGWGLRDDQMRRAFSMQTCCGCHCGDTSTRFFHVEPRSLTAEAGLSKYLRTDGSRWRSRDPASRTSFLSAEIEDRKRLYQGLLNPGLPLREIKRIRGSRIGRVH